VRHRNQEILTQKKSGGFKRAAGFYSLERCMCPISFVLDSLLKDVRCLDTTIVAGGSGWSGVVQNCRPCCNR
jgi:hypothetical protein